MRILYYVSTVHTEALHEDVAQKRMKMKDRKYKKYPPALKKLAEILPTASIEQLKELRYAYWETIINRVRRKIKIFEGLVVFQEGVCKGEGNFTAQYLLNENHKSPEYLLFKELLEKGAILVDTEDEESSNAGWNLYGSLGPRDDHSRAMRDAVAERDTAIAKEINNSLPKNSRGILFIGKDGHAVDKYLRKMERGKELTSPIKIVHLITKQEIAELNKKQSLIIKKASTKN